MKEYFYIHVKIILSGEYAVLDVAWSIALSIRQGQRLEIERTKNQHQLLWISYSEHGTIWFESVFLSPYMKILYTNYLKITSFTQYIV